MIRLRTQASAFPVMVVGEYRETTVSIRTAAGESCELDMRA
jgi:hypothetical protein